MKLWLVRHTQAEPAEDDALRPLSAEGRAAAIALGRYFRQNGVLERATICWHSPLTRAVETATLLCREAGLKAKRRETGTIAPESDPAQFAGFLETWTEGDAIVVGHEPHLSALGTLLVRGKPKPVQFEMKKGAVLALASTGGTHKKNRCMRWEVRWMLAPELLRAAEETKQP